MCKLLIVLDVSFFFFCPSDALCSHVRLWPAESLSREVNHLAISVSEAPCSPDDSSADWPNWTPVYGAITRHCFLYGTQIVVLGADACKRQYLCGLAQCAGFDSLLTYPVYWRLFISDWAAGRGNMPVCWWCEDSKTSQTPASDPLRKEKLTSSFFLIVVHCVVTYD